LEQLQQGRAYDYITIDLGSDTSRRWLTSRLYLLALLLTLIDQPSCLVFVETVGDVRKRFVGLASPDRARRDLARAYSWLDSASVAAYATVGGLIQWVPAAGVWQLNAAQNFALDPATGGLSGDQFSQLVQQFLTQIRVPPTPAGSPPPEEWVPLSDQWMEHAKWLDGSRLERLLGNDLQSSYVTLTSNTTVSGLTGPILRQQGHFVAVVDPDKTFRGLVDRSAVLEHLAAQFLKQTAV